MVTVGDNDNRKFIPTDPCYEVLASECVAKSQRHDTNEFVANWVTERIVDILEVVKVDIKHSCRWTTVARLFDLVLQALAKMGAVRQVAQRIVHGEVSQPALAAGSLGSFAPQLVEHRQREEGENCNPYQGERNRIPGDLGSGTRRCPGELRDCLAPAVHQLVCVIAKRRRDAVDYA